MKDNFSLVATGEPVEPNAPPVANDDELVGFTPSALTDEIRVNSPDDLNQFDPAMTALVDGGFVASWSISGEDNLSQGFGIQRFSVDGSKLGEQIIIEAAEDGFAANPSLAALPNGGFAVTWTTGSYSAPDADGNRTTDNPNVLYQFYNAEGQAVGTPAQLTSNNVSFESKIIALNNDEFAIAWAQNSTDELGASVQIQRFDAEGNTIGEQFQANSREASSIRKLDLTALDNGNIFISWSQQIDGFNYDVQARIFNTNGRPTNDEFTVHNESDQFQWGGISTQLSNGNILVSWRAIDFENATGIITRSTFAQIIDSEGEFVEETFQLNSPEHEFIGTPIVIALENGGFLATWYNSSPNSDGYFEDRDIYGQRFDNDGNKIGDVFNVSPDSPNNQINYGEQSLIQLENGNIVSIWTDETQNDIFMRMFAPDSPTISEDDSAVILASSLVPALLANDGDADGDELTIVDFSETSTAGASIFRDNDGNFVFNPNDVFDYLAEGETTTDTFTYTIADGNGGTDTATVTYRITGVNDAPVLAHPISDHSFNEGEQVYVGLPYGMFEDVDNTTGLDFSISQADGSELPEWLTFYTGDGEFRGIAPEGSAGTYSIRVSASDGFATASDVFEITISDEITPPTTEPTRVLFEDDFADGVRAFTEGNNGNSATVAGGELALVGGAWTQAGFSLNSVQSIDADNNILELQIYRDAGSNGVLSLRDASWRQFVLNENNNQFWSVDGETGFSGLNDLEEGQWHTLRIDMDAIGMSSFRIFGIMGNANGNDSFQIDDVAIFNEDYGIEEATDSASAELLSADEDDAFIVTKSSAPADAQPAWTEYDENSYASNEEKSDQSSENAPSMEIISDDDDAFYSPTVQDDFLI